MFPLGPRVPGPWSLGPLFIPTQPHALEILITRCAIQYATFITLFMNLVKGYKACHEQLKNTSSSIASEPSSTLLLELAKPE